MKAPKLTINQLKNEFPTLENETLISLSGGEEALAYYYNDMFGNTWISIDGGENWTYGSLVGWGDSAVAWDGGGFGGGSSGGSAGDGSGNGSGGDGGSSSGSMGGTSGGWGGGYGGGSSGDGSGGTGGGGSGSGSVGGSNGAPSDGTGGSSGSGDTGSIGGIEGTYGGGNSGPSSNGGTTGTPGSNGQGSTGAVSAYGAAGLYGSGMSEAEVAALLAEGMAETGVAAEVAATIASIIAAPEVIAGIAVGLVISALLAAAKQYEDSHGQQYTTSRGEAVNWADFDPNQDPNNPLPQGSFTVALMVMLGIPTLAGLYNVLAGLYGWPPLDPFDPSIGPPATPPATPPQYYPIDPNTGQPYIDPNTGLPYNPFVDPHHAELMPEI